MRLGRVLGPLVATVRAEDLDEALTALAAHGDDAKVLRYDGKTGDFIDAFVFDDPKTKEDETGGLACVRGLIFGPDGNLYVSGGCSDQRADDRNGQ